ncbi:hypothetical protein [Streptomyces exfoliatus]|uniref:hypothetical protein n=1 Tax=Streptomyces exfoliatus TaxID=1905 RepID=UPI000465B956|nr:hypothetical protein [Streptomyces exfoliatus]
MMTIAVYRVDADGASTPVTPKYVVKPDEDFPVNSGFPPCSCLLCVPLGWCDFHEGPSQTDQPVDQHGRACLPCREQRGLTPRPELEQR